MAGSPATWPPTGLRSRDEPLTSLRAATSALGNPRWPALLPPPRAGKYRKGEQYAAERTTPAPEDGLNTWRVTQGEVALGIGIFILV